MQFQYDPTASQAKKEYRDATGGIWSEPFYELKGEITIRKDKNGCCFCLTCCDCDTENRILLLPAIYNKENTGFHLKKFIDESASPKNESMILNFKVEIKKATENKPRVFTNLKEVREYMEAEFGINLKPNTNTATRS